MNEDDRTNEIGLARFAREYYDSAVAADEVVGSRPGYEHVAPAPVMHLVAQSIELALKAFLRWKGVSLKGVVRLGHDLDACLSEANKHGLARYVELSQEERDLFSLISKLHTSTELRYIRTGAKQLPIFGPLQTLAKRILDAICPAVGYR